MHLITRILRDLGWRKKIFLFNSLIMALILLIGGFGIFTIYDQNKSMQENVKRTVSRVNAATEARSRLLELEKTLSIVILESESKNIRAQAVAAIRLLSLLDEKIQMLAKVLENHPKVTELGNLIAKIRPIQIDIIKAAKKNEDESALNLINTIHDESTQINQLSNELVESEHANFENVQTASTQKGYTVINLMAWLVAIGILISIIASLVLASLLTKPLIVIKQLMNSVSEGDLTATIVNVGKDELGETINATMKTIENLQGILQLITSDSDSLSEESIKIDGAAGSIQGISRKLHSQIETIKEKTSVVITTTEHVSSTFHAASESAKNTAESSRTSAAGILQTVGQFQQFQKRLVDTTESSKQLAKFAQKVSTIIDSIKGISSQTNLLALNATIEAARAGENGRGFAVVADEVRVLAKRTDDSTAEIIELIDGISANVEITVQSMEESILEANKSIETLSQLGQDVNNSSHDVSDMHTIIMESSELMESQNKAVAEINLAISELFEVSTNTNAQTETLHDLSGSLKSASAGLHLIVGRFKLQ